MKQTPSLLVTSALVACIAACGGGDEDATSPSSANSNDTAAAPEEEHEHEHDETSLGSALVGDLLVEFAQGHGAVVAGADGHLVVKLPYSDSGSTVVRAWIGSSDRTLSYVGKGEYAPSHDDYDIHATAPDPLPADPMWWVEVEKPDGAKLLGSVKPIL